MFSKYGGKMKKIKLLFFASFLSLLSFSASAVDITIARFFGDCEDAGSDTKATSGEACIIQSIINAFNEQNPDINVTTEVLDWVKHTIFFKQDMLIIAHLICISCTDTVFLNSHQLAL